MGAAFSDRPVVRGIKSVQRGTLAISGASADATISAVDETKSEVVDNGATVAAVSDETDHRYELQLVGPTTLRGTRTGTNGSVTVSYEVVEYK